MVEIWLKFCYGSNIESDDRWVGIESGIMCILIRNYVIFLKEDVF